MKRCRVCATDKSVDAFRPQRRSCRECDNTASRKYRLDNKTGLNARRRLQYSTDLEKQSSYQSSRYRFSQQHRENKLAYNRLWNANNRDRINRRRKVRYQTDIRFRLSSVISNYIRATLNRNKVYKNRSWEKLVSFTIHELKEHLEKQFLPGMSWSNYGEWHIDHKRPVVSFSFNSYDSSEFRECWSLENLQPLWARDNISKGAKLL